MDETDGADERRWGITHYILVTIWITVLKKNMWVKVLALLGVVIGTFDTSIAVYLSHFGAILKQS